MKRILSAVFLAVFGLAISASAGPAEFEVSQDELNGLERLLQEAEFQPQNLTDDDFDDDDDSDEIDDGSRKIRNPFAWLKKQFKNKCVCESSSCDCCFKLKLFKSTACFSAEVLETEKKVQVRFSINDKSMVNKQFDMNRNDSVCGNVPIPVISFLKFCFTQNSEMGENSAISSCSAIEFRVGNTPGAVIQFKCLELKEGKFTFGGYKKLEKSQMLVLKAKNPFKAAVALYQKATGKKN